MDSPVRKVRMDAGDLRVKRGPRQPSSRSGESWSEQGKGRRKGGGKDGKIGRSIEERRGRQGKRKDKKESEVSWGTCCW